MKIDKDFIYATPVFYFKLNSNLIIDAEDFFISCCLLNEEREIISYPRDSKITIEHFYEGVDEMRELKKKCWAI